MVNDDLLDPQLQMVMGPDRCRDLTAPAAAGRKTVSRQEPVDNSWAPKKPEPGLMERLKACAKYVSLYGGLNILIFSWQQLGLMDEKVAMPSMIVCAVLGGLCIGKYALR